MTGSHVRLALLGAHNSGKTTLAEKLAEVLGIKCVKTSTSAVFAARGLDPASTLDFGTRLSIQGDVLDSACAQWRGAASSGGYVSDRSSLDMAGYLLGDIQNETPAPGRAAQEYLARCYEAVREHFDHVVLVPPGVKLAVRPGKAAPSEAYIEHLHYTMLGLLSDQERLGRMRTSVMPRTCLALEERIRFVQDFLTSGHG
jgi:predicted ATPase